MFVPLCRSTHELAHMVDALASCLFSSKLKLEDRFWALKQLLKVFSRVCGKNRNISNDGNNGYLIMSLLILPLLYF